jgi:predicted amidohydrolase
MFHEIKVAAFSFVPRKLDLAANADRMERYFRMAARRGAQLALGPEEILDGYPVRDVLANKMPPQRMLDAAVTIDHPHIRRFKTLAKELKMCLAFGFAERLKKEVFNCAVFIDDRGRLRGRYHKMLLAEGHEPGQWYNRVGSRSRAIDTPFGRCGFMICNDRWNADLARIPVLDGARFMLIPSFGTKTRIQDEAVLAVARQNGIPVLEANVGVLLLVSKGQIVKRLKKDTGMIVGTMAIPAAPSEANRNLQEKRFLAWRKSELPRRYRRRLVDSKYAERTNVRATQI